MKLVEFNTSLNIVQSARLWSDKDPALTHAKDLCYYQSFNLGLNSKPFFFPRKTGERRWVIKSEKGQKEKSKHRDLNPLQTLSSAVRQTNSHSIGVAGSLGGRHRGKQKRTDRHAYASYSLTSLRCHQELPYLFSPQAEGVPQACWKVGRR